MVAPLVVPPLGLARRVLTFGTVVWSVPHPLSAASQPCRFVLGGGGALSAPPFSHPPTFGGQRFVGGGGLLSSLRCTHVGGRTQARRRHEARHPSVCRGGGGHALWLQSSPFLPCVRTAGVPPAGACTARALYGHGRVIRPAPSRRILPTLLLCPRGGALFAPPTCISHPWGGGGVLGGEGRPCRLPFVARMSQAGRKHDACTG